MAGPGITRANALLAPLLLVGVAAGGCETMLDLGREPADRITDDASDAIAPTGRFCDTVRPPPDFCADFDNGSYAEGWANENTSPDPGLIGGGTLALDTMTFQTPPGSARATIPALVSSTNAASAFLLTALPARPRKATVQFEMRIDTESFPAANGHVVLLSLHFINQGTIEVVRFAGQTQLVLIDDVLSTSPHFTLADQFPVGQWTTFTISIHNYPTMGSDGDILATIGGSVGQLILPQHFQTAPDVPRFSLGAPYAVGPMGEFRLNLDNVRVWITESY
jgi:hypothetical protein